MIMVMAMVMAMVILLILQTSIPVGSILAGGDTRSIVGGSSGSSRRGSSRLRGRTAIGISLGMR